jgi:hypothetical protein
MAAPGGSGGVDRDVEEALRRAEAFAEAQRRREEKHEEFIRLGQLRHQQESQQRRRVHESEQKTRQQERDEMGERHQQRVQQRDTMHTQRMQQSTDAFDLKQQERQQRLQQGATQFQQVFQQKQDAFDLKQQGQTRIQQNREEAFQQQQQHKATAFQTRQQGQQQTQQQSAARFQQTTQQRQQAHTQTMGHRQTRSQQQTARHALQMQGLQQTQTFRQQNQAFRTSQQQRVLANQARARRAASPLGRVITGFRRGATIARDAAVGLSLAGGIAEAEDLYTRRARGIISVGMSLTQSFASVSRALDVYRQQFTISGPDMVRAMHAYGGIMGKVDAPGFENALRFGTAYGIDPEKAGHLGAMAQRLSLGVNPLSIAQGTYTTRMGGRTSMATEQVTDEVLRMMQQAGARGVQLPAEYFGNLAGMIGGIGPHMQVPGAISRFAEHLTQGVNQSPDLATYAFRQNAIQEMLAERRRTGASTLVDLGGGVQADLSEMHGRRLLAENASASPQLMEMYRQRSIRMAGGNKELEKTFFAEYVTGQGLNALQAEQLRQQAEQTKGGFLGLRTFPGQGSNLSQQEQVRQLSERSQQTEFQNVDLPRVSAERGMEFIGASFVKARNEIREAIGKVGESLGDQVLTWDRLDKVLQNVSGQTVILVGALQALSAQSAWGFGTGMALVAGGASKIAFGMNERIPDSLQPLPGQGRPGGSPSLAPSGMGP